MHEKLRTPVSCMFRKIFHNNSRLIIAGISLPFYAINRYQQPQDSILCDDLSYRPLQFETIGIDKLNKLNVQSNKFSIVNDKVMGRRMVANQLIKAGEVIFIETPLFSGIDSGPTVEDCFSPSARNMIPPRLAGFLADICAEVKKESKFWFSSSARLQALDYFYRQSDADFEAASKTHEDRAFFIHSMLKKEYQALIPVAHLSMWLDIFASNNHAILNNSGSGIFPLLHILEHSCDPNVFYGPKLVAAPKDEAKKKDVDLYLEASRALRLVAARDIHPGEALSITYVDVDQLQYPTFMRRKFLQKQFNFECNCTRCSSSPEVVRAFTCPNCKQSELCPPHPSHSRFLKGGAIASACLKCRSCHFVPPIEMVDKFWEAEQSAYKLVIARQQAANAENAGIDPRMLRAMEPSKAQQELLGEFHFIRVRLLLHDLKEAATQRCQDRSMVSMGQKMKNEGNENILDSNAQSAIAEANSRLKDRKTDEMIASWTDNLIKSQRRLLSGAEPFVQIYKDLRALSTQIDRYVKEAESSRSSFFEMPEK